MEFAMPEYVSLKDHSVYDERWLHERIIENPSLLGLGELVVVGSERPQPGAGRLDLLLSNPEADTRYEVELQLGATNESHLVRTIEYWDIERKRYPQYDHVAVIVAEDVTSRFLNVIGLFNDAIPLIAIQVKAVKVAGKLTLVATQVLGLRSLGTDEEDGGEAADRAYWEAKSSIEALSVCTAIVKMIRDVKPDINAHYTKAYIGLRGHSGVQNFVVMWPKKGGHVNSHFKIPYNTDVDRMVDESSLGKISFKPGSNKCKVQVRKEDVEERREIILELIERAHRARFG